MTIGCIRIRLSLEPLALPPPAKLGRQTMARSYMIRSRRHIAPDEMLLVVNKFPRPSVEIEIEAIAAKSG
jgi:enamine deaminase RidA (YjgF/YER057c/UK114 family)